MGAWMCNTIFSAPGTKLVYIAPEGWNEVFFWNLADQFDHEYYVYYTGTNLIQESPEEEILMIDPDKFLNFYSNIVDLR